MKFKLSFKQFLLNEDEHLSKHSLHLAARLQKALAHVYDSATYAENLIADAERELGIKRYKWGSISPNQIKQAVLAVTNIADKELTKQAFDKTKFGLDEGKGPFGLKLSGVSTEKPQFRFTDRKNAIMAADALKAAGIAFKRGSAYGIFFFDFDDMATMKKAAKIVKQVIDREVEDNW